MIGEVFRAAKKAYQGIHRDRMFCMLVELDVKNAFNCAHLTGIKLRSM